MQIHIHIPETASIADIETILRLASQYGGATVQAAPRPLSPVASSVKKGPKELEYERLTGSTLRTALKGDEREAYAATKIAMAGGQSDAVSIPADAPAEGATFSGTVDTDVDYVFDGADDD